MKPDTSSQTTEHAVSLRTARGALLLACACAVPLLVLVFVLSSLGQPSIEDLKRDGNVLIRELDEYKQQHGQYPVTLESAGIRQRVTWSGGFRYSVCRDRTAFELVIGDYAKDYFVLGWASVDEEWWLDE